MPELTPEQMESVILSQDRELKAVRDREERSLKDAAVGTAIEQHGFQVDPSAREMICELLRGKLIPYPINGQTIVMGPSGQSIGDFVKERLSQPEYQRFLRSGSGPGSGQAQGQPAGPTGIALIDDYMARQRQGGDPSPNRNMSMVMGLRKPT